MSLRVLAISSHPADADPLRADLLRYGCEVARLHPDELERRVQDVPLPHVVVVDVRGGETNLQELCEIIRGRRRLRDVPLLAIVPEQRLSRPDFWHEVADFVAAPYRWDELRARLSRLGARADGAPSAMAVRVGDLVLDPESYDVTMAGARVDLTLKEYELLKYLVTHAGRVFTRDQLLNRVWGYDYVGGTRTVDVHIRRLRAKLGEVGERGIETIRGVGYAFRAERAQMPSPAGAKARASIG